MSNIQLTNRINPYNSIGICYVTRSGGFRNKFWYTPFDEKMYQQFGKLPEKYLMTDGDDDIEEDPPCSSDDTGIVLFLNDPDVQKQLHVPTMKWEPCRTMNFHKDVTTIPLF